MSRHTCRVTSLFAVAGCGQRHAEAISSRCDPGLPRGSGSIEARREDWIDLLSTPPRLPFRAGSRRVASSGYPHTLLTGRVARRSAPVVAGRRAVAGALHVSLCSSARVRTLSATAGSPRPLLSAPRFASSLLPRGVSPRPLLPPAPLLPSSFPSSPRPLPPPPPLPPPLFFPLSFSLSSARQPDPLCAPALVPFSGCRHRAYRA